MSAWDLIAWLRRQPDRCPGSVIVISAGERASLGRLDPNVVNAIRELARQPLVVRGDPQRLRQLVWNLLSNAIKLPPRRVASRSPWKCGIAEGSSS